MKYALLAVLVCVVTPLTAGAHPGRLDSTGCHDVHTRFVYKSGKVAKPGTRHCHRGLGAAKLDGSEVLDEGGPDEARDPLGVPMSLEPHRRITAVEINAAIADLGCTLLRPFHEREPVLPPVVEALMRCAVGRPHTEATALTIKRMRWMRGERW